MQYIIRKANKLTESSDVSEDPLSDSPGCGPIMTPEPVPVRPLRQQVFERVRAGGLIPRVQVARDLNVSPASVTTLTSELIQRGFLEEVAIPRDRTDSGRGRPPVALGVRPETHFVAGVKLSDRVHTAVVVDFAGKKIAEDSLEVTRDGGWTLPDLLAATGALLDRTVAKAGMVRGDLSGVGIGVPGFVDHATGQVLWSPVLDMRDVDFAGLAEKYLGLPVTIDNDANLVALAELWFGAGREMSEFAIVTIEHGVGMGLVLNHRLYRGARGLGMELGHTKVQLDGALCRCGQRGCLEAYVADYALVREANTALNWLGQDGRPMRVQLESLFEQAKAGDAAARSIFHRAGRYLAVGLANVVNLFDPALIILSGERMRYDYLYASDRLAELETLVLNTGKPPPQIKVQAWGDLLWAYGAAALALSTVTDQVLSTGWDIAAQ